MLAGSRKPQARLIFVNSYLMFIFCFFTFFCVLLLGPIGAYIVKSHSEKFEAFFGFNLDNYHL